MSESVTSPIPESEMDRQVNREAAEAFSLRAEIRDGVESLGLADLRAIMAAIDKARTGRIAPNA